MTIYQGIYEVISPVVSPYETVYPFTGNHEDLEHGSCSFLEISRKNITSGEQKQQVGGTCKISSTIEINVQINLSRFVNYEDAGNNATEKASKLQAYLKSNNALELFYSKGYDMAPVWSDILTEGYLTDEKKWALKAYFEMKFYVLNEIELPSEPLKYIETKIEEN